MATEQEAIASALDGGGDNSYRVASSELRQFVERIEHLNAEKQDVLDSIKDVKAEAKARGYDTKVLARVIATRRRDAALVAEEDAIFNMYMEALGL